MFEEAKIKEFGSKIHHLIQGKDMSRQETKEIFSQVLLNQQPDLQQGAFLAALTAKGETVDEIAGCWEAIYELDTVKVSPITPTPLVENCGTGMDELKTFNISTAASVVAAANGIYLAKHGARAITSKCGAVDILEKLGINVECDAQVVKKSIENCGIGIFNGMNSKIHPQALGRILAQIRFGTTLNIAASLANPALPSYGVRGVYSEGRVELVARVMKKIGYRRAYVVHGLSEKGGMDELSTLGENIVSELKENGRIENYSFYPEDVGLPRGRYEEISPAEDIEEEAENFIELISGKIRDSRYDILCLNVAPILYIMGRAKDVKDGIKKAKNTVESGRALKKLNEWLNTQR